MELEEMVAQCQSDSRRWFPGKQSLPMMVLCLAGEVGEVANIVKKVERGSLSQRESLEDLAEEIVDVQIYLANIMGLPLFHDVDWKLIWEEKRAFNEARFGHKARRTELQALEGPIGREFRHLPECKGPGTDSCFEYCVEAARV